MRASPSRRAFTLVELLVVIAIIGIMVGLLLPAISKVREAGNRARCMSNMKQLVLAVHSYQDANSKMPTYFYENGFNAWSSQYCSWMLLLLPYMDNDPLFKAITGNATPGGPITAPGKPAAGGYWSPPPTRTMTNPGSPGTWQLVATGFYNGFTVYTMQLVGYVAPSYTYNYTGCTYVPYVAAVPPSYGPPGPPVAQGYWYRPNIPLEMFRCRSDGTWPIDKLYPYTSPGVTLTNYEANWNAFGDSGWKPGDGDSMYSAGPPGAEGYMSRAQMFNAMTDGLSNTIFLGEAYANCDGSFHTAFYSWCPGGRNVGQTFGLTWPLGVGALNGSNSPAVAISYGMANTFMFQLRPLPYGYAGCPQGGDCCNPWVTQTPHERMPVAMGDGGVRLLGEISQETWRYLCQPRDGQSIPQDY